jgi:hypothetical protein
MGIDLLSHAANLDQGVEIDAGIGRAPAAGRIDPRQRSRRIPPPRGGLMPDNGWQCQPTAARKMRI